jgi:hypothetical protein
MTGDLIYQNALVLKRPFVLLEAARRKVRLQLPIAGVSGYQPPGRQSQIQVPKVPEEV